MQGQQELGHVAEGLRAVFQPFGQQPAAAVAAAEMLEDIEIRAHGVVEVGAQRAAGVIRRVERQRHQPQVAHVGRVVVVAAEAHLLPVGQERRIVEQPNRLGVMVAARDHFLRPAQEDLADGGLVLGAERRVDPVHHQRERFAVIADAVAVLGGEVGVAEGRVLP